MRAGIRSLLCPPKCVSCGTLLDFQGLGAEVPALCRHCRELWQSETLDTCGVCAKAVSQCTCMTEELKKAHCAEFRKRVYYIHGKNSPVQNRILFRIKKRPSLRAIEFLADELEKSVRSLLTENGLFRENAVLMYLPRGRHAYAASGTDQGKRLAYALSKRTGIAVCPAIERRRGQERQQKSLDLAQRRRNAKASYVLKEALVPEGKTVLLVDDIVTTGSTIAAGARLLRGTGVTAVYALSVAVDDSQKNAGAYLPKFRI